VNLAAVFGVKMNKKASANMWWIIIGAVIALVVMIILMVMFTGKVKPLEQGLSACEGKGGVCVTGSCPINTFKSSAFDCTTSKDCCIGAPKKCKDDSECKTPKEKCGTDKYCYESTVTNNPGG
jgi:hypothetical protein